MPTVLVSHSVKVNAPAKVVWGLLLDKVRRPDKYVPGVTKVEVVKELGAHQIERKMWLENGTEIHEFITADELTHTVVFKSASNPKMRGFVTNTLYEEGDSVYLDYTMNWDFKGDAPPDQQKASVVKIQQAVEHTKKLAEEEAAK